MTRRRTALAIALTLASRAVAAQPAVAELPGAKSAPVQPPPSVSVTHASEADALFAEAKALREAGNYPAACDKFAASDRLSPGIGVALYLADCYDRVGKTASAWVSFRAAERRAIERKDERAQIARDRAKALEPKLSRVTFAVAHSLQRRGVEIWLDDAGPVAAETYALGIAADPGDHIVALKFAGRTVQSVHAHVIAGGSAALVTLVEPPLPPSVAAPLRTETDGASRASGATSDGQNDRRDEIELGLLVLGGAGLAAGAGLLVAKNGSVTNSADAAPSLNESASAASVASFAVAGAAFATAVVLYLTAPKRHDAALGPVTLAPIPLVAGGGVALMARF